MPTRLVAPRPQVVDALPARVGDRRLEARGSRCRRARSSAARAGRRRRGARMSRGAAARSGARTGLPSSFQCFQYGSVAKVAAPAALRRGSSRRCRAFLRSTAAGRRCSPAARGDVREHLAQEVDDRRLAERLHLGRALRRDRRRRSAPRTARSGTSSARGRRCRRAPAPSRRARPRRPSRRRTRAPSRPTPCRRRDSAALFRHAPATRRPSSSTWHSSGWNVTQRLSASPPNVRPSPHGRRLHGQPGSVRGLDDLAPSCRGSTRSRSRRTCAAPRSSRARRGRPCRVDVPGIRTPKYEQPARVTEVVMTTSSSHGPRGQAELNPALKERKNATFYSTGHRGLRCLRRQR